MLDQIITYILRSASNDDINKITEACKMRRTQLTKQNVRKFFVGDTVQFTSSKTGRVTQGRIKKINIKYIIVDTGVAGTWRVPANMLTMATET